MNKQEVIDFLVKCGMWVKDGRIAKADVARAVASIKVIASTLTISTKDPKAPEMLTIAGKVGLDWSIFKNKLTIKGNGSEEHNKAMVQIMEMAEDYSLAEVSEADTEPRAKTPKGKKLLQELKDGGFKVKGISAEQYGTRRFMYVRFESNEERLKGEKFLREKGHKVSKSYWPGSGTAEVFIGGYNGKYDGHVEASERITLDEYSMLAEGVPFKDLPDRAKFYIQDEHSSLIDLDEKNYQSNIEELKAQK